MFYKYILIGVLSVFVDYLCLYIAFSLMGIEVKMAVTIAFSISFVFNYTANKYFCFNHTAKHFITIIKYSLLVTATYLLTLYIVYELMAQGLSVYIAKLLSISMVFLISFTLNNYWVYK